MLYLVIFGEKFSSNSPKISKKKLVTHLDKIRSALTEYNRNASIFAIFYIPIQIPWSSRPHFGHNPPKNYVSRHLPTSRRIIFFETFCPSSNMTFYWNFVRHKYDQRRRTVVKTTGATSRLRECLVRGFSVLKFQFIANSECY